MANWVENTVEITGSKEYIAALKEWAGENFSFNNMIPHPKKNRGDNVEKDGHDNWYDWNIDNWGTKWNCWELNADWGETLVSMFFLTAWGPPEPIYKAIIEKFPNLQVKWHYSGPGSCYSGDFDTGEEFDHADPCEEENCDHNCEHCGENQKGQNNGQNNG